MTVITISRQFGSGGRKIAAQVCELLGYRYFDKELIAQVATEAGLLTDEAVDFSEENYKGKRFIDRLLFPGPYNVAEIPTWRRDETGTKRLSVQSLDESRFLNLIRGVILTAYDHGNVVIVGRGGQAVLAQLPQVLHVRIEAPLENRILRIQTQEKLDPAEARALMVERDRTVAKYLGDMFKVRPDDTRWYHLVINTGKWSLQAAAQIIVNAVGQLPVEPVACRSLRTA